MNAKVILVRRMPFYIPYLDYSIPKELEGSLRVGNLVQAPFRTKTEYGVVFCFSSDDKIKNLKPIECIVGINPVLTEKQLNFLFAVSRLYHTSLGFLLKTNLLPLQKRKLSELVFSRHELTIASTKPVEVAYCYSNAVEKEKYILSAISGGGQKLILVPELSLIDEIYKNFNDDDAVIISGELSNKELFERWVDVQSGRKSIIIGARRALFLPWFDLKDIIIVDEANPNYKSWDMAPRYETADAAGLLAKEFGSKIHYIGHTPSLKTYFNFSPQPNKLQNAFLEIIDMRNERKSRNYGFMSDSLSRAILDTKDGDVFIFLNRRGSSSYVGCRDCGFVYKCPICKLSLTYHQNSGNLECHYCDFKIKMSTACPKCHGITLNMFGAGTQLAETEIKKLVFGKRPVVRFDSDNGNFSSIKENNDKVIVGTQFAWQHVDWGRVKLMVFADSDSSLFIPEFNVSEIMWYLLRDAKYRMPLNSKIIIQTGNPNNILFTSLNNPEKFYMTELVDRKALSYPPFYFIVRLFSGYVSDALAGRESEKLYDSLEPLTKRNSDIIISHPLPMTPVIYQRRYWRVIIVKIAQNDNVFRNWEIVADKVPNDWKVDPNPNSLLNFS